MSYAPVVIIVATLLAYVAIGLWSARTVKSSDSFLIASGQLGWLPLTGTYVATYTSSVTVLGAAAGIYAAGISYLWVLISFAAGACLTAVVAPRFRKASITTPADFFKVRYGSDFLVRITTLGSIVALIFGLMAQFTGMGIVWSLALNRSFGEGIIVTAVVMLIIIASGGLVSVAWSDVLKAFVFWVAAVVGAIWVLSKVGGLKPLIEQVVSGYPGHASITAGVGGPLGILFIFLTWTCGIATHPQYLQRISASKDETANLMQYTLGWIMIAMVFISLSVVGLLGRALIEELPAGYTRDYVGPLLMQRHAPIVVYGLFLAGLMAAALSTADSVIQLCVSLVAKNVVKDVMKPDMSDRFLLTVSRYLSVFLVLFIAALALYRWAWIIYIAAYCWGILAILYFAPVMIGLFWKRVNTIAASVSVIGGLLAFLAAQTLALLGRWPYKEVPPTGVGVLAGIALIILISSLTPSPDEQFTEPFFTG